MLIFVKPVSPILLLNNQFCLVNIKLHFYRKPYKTRIFIHTDYGKYYTQQKFIVKKTLKLC